MKKAAALPAVLFALAITSALAVGGAYVSRQLAASVGLSHRSLELRPVAEIALIDHLVAWDSAARADQPVGSVVSFPTSSASFVQTEVWITRASTSLYWLVAEVSHSSKPVLRRRVGILVRVSGGPPALVPDRAWSELP